MEKKKNLEVEETQATLAQDEKEEESLDSLEDAVNRLSQRVKRLVKKNGFSKGLKKKAEMEL